MGFQFLSLVAWPELIAWRRENGGSRMREAKGLERAKAAAP